MFIFRMHNYNLRTVHLDLSSGQRNPGLAKHVWHVLFLINVYSDATDAGAMRSGMLFRPDNHWSVIDVIDLYRENAIGLYRDVWIAAIASPRTNLATLSGVMCNTSQ